MTEIASTYLITGLTFFLNNRNMLLLGATKCPGKKVEEEENERVKKDKEEEVATEEGKKKTKEKEPSTHWLTNNGGLWDVNRVFVRLKLT